MRDEVSDKFLNSEYYERSLMLNNSDINITFEVDYANTKIEKQYYIYKMVWRVIGDIKTNTFQFYSLYAEIDLEVCNHNYYESIRRSCTCYIVDDKYAKEKDLDNGYVLNQYYLYPVILDDNLKLSKEYSFYTNFSFRWEEYISYIKHNINFTSHTNYVVYFDNTINFESLEFIVKNSKLPIALRFRHTVRIDKLIDLFLVLYDKGIKNEELDVEYISNNKEEIFNINFNDFKNVLSIIHSFSYNKNIYNFKNNKIYVSVNNIKRKVLETKFKNKE